MAAQLSTKLTLDGTQHNEALRGAAKELSKYKREVAANEKQLKTWTNQSRTATGSVRTFTDAFKQGNIKGMMIGASGATATFGGTLVKLGGWFGGAMGAAELFNKSINGSQATIDEYGRIQESVNTVVNNFFSSLSSGDFSPFLNGIGNMIDRARDAYNAMDSLWNMSQSFGVQNARLNNQFQSNLIQMRKLKGSNNPEDKKKYNQLKQQNNNIINQQSSGGNKLYDQSIKALQEDIRKGTGMRIKVSGGIITQIVEADIVNMEGKRAEYKKQYKNYLSDLEAMNKKYDRDFQKGGMGRNGVNYRNESIALEKKYGGAIAANYLLERKSDEELQSFNNTLKQALAYQGQAIANQSKMVRYDKETPITGGGNKSTTKRTGGGSNQIQYAAGSVGALEQEISDLNKQIKFQVDSSEIEKLQKRIKELQKQLDNLMNPVKPAAPVDLSVFSTSPIIGPNLSKIKLPEIHVPDLAEQYESITDKINKVMDAADMGMIGAKQANEYIDEFNKQLESLGLNTVKIHVESDGEKAVRETGEVISQMADSFSGLGAALEMPELDIAGLIAGSIASIMEGYGTATAQAASMGPWAWIAFAIAGLAQVATMVAQIHSLSGYAEGGIIQGNSYSGDRMLARVNSGEMILNSRQQRNLFSAIDSNRLGGSGGNAGQVSFHIKGKDLEGVLRNYDDKMRKVR